MNPSELAEKRKNSLISITYFAVFAVIYFLFVKFALGITAPFIIAFLIAMVLQKPIRFIDKKTFLNKKLASVVFVLLIVAILAGILALVGYRLVAEFTGFFQLMKDKLGNYTQAVEIIKNWIAGVLSHLPTALSDKAKEAIDGVTGSVLKLAEKSETAMEETVQTSGGFDISILSTPLSGILSTAKQIPAILTAVLISIVSCFFMTSDYDNFTNMIKHSVSEQREATLVRAKHIIINVLGKWCKSYAILLFITFCEMSLGLSILKIAGIYKGGYIFVIAVCTALLDILPVFGTGTVLVPWAVISLCTHHIGMGIGLIVIYAIITVIRQILEPKIVSSNVDVNPVVTLMSMYIGLQLFGALGIIILPLTVIIVKTLNDEGVIHLWGRAEAEEIPETSAEPEAETEAPAQVNAEK